MGDQDNRVYVTGIKIFSDTRDRLLERGRKNETYDTLINRLLSESDGRASR